jgi:AraC-like DNA-binding protein
MEEAIEFRHSPHLMGVGVLHAHHTERKWHVINSAYGLAVPGDWIGELQYRGEQRVFEGGDVFCTEPGEVHETSRITRKGAFKALLIDERPLLEHVAEIAPRLRASHFRSIGGRMSPQLGNRLNALFRLIGTEAAPLLVQSTMVELVACMVEELLEDPKPNRVTPGHTRTLERARECLHDSDEDWVDLETLAREAGLSRFHLLRSFKERYGLPPHAYQVRLRVAKAMQLLRGRVPPAQVAAECGFTDQSHFTRHFKQVLGVTPGRFARDLAAR